MLVRLAIFLAFLVITLLAYILESEDDRKFWPIYLTNWGLSICTIQAFLGFSMVFYSVIAYYYQFEKRKFASKLYWLYWMASTTAISIAFTISLIYWTLLYKGTKKHNFSRTNWVNRFRLQRNIGQQWIWWHTEWIRS